WISRGARKWSPSPSPSWAASPPFLLGAMLGGSSGVMLYIAFADLIPDSALAIGYPYTWLFFVLGVVGFSLVMYYIPEPHFDGDDDDEGHGHSHGHGSREERSGCENAEARHGPTKAGLATAIGMCIHNLPEGIAVYISCLRSSSPRVYDTSPSGYAPFRTTRHDQRHDTHQAW
ncbi:uncharacterized protein ACA1_078220, partial [Acanthamoeba castellanii str. Neff]